MDRRKLALSRWGDPKSSSRRKSFEKRPPINFERGTQTQRNVRGGPQQPLPEICILSKPADYPPPVRYPAIRPWLGDRMQFDQIIKRRDFITLLGGAAAAWPLAARAQQGERMRRIGVLMNLAADDPEGQTRITAFVQGLQQLGWSVGRNVRIDTRWGGGDAERFRRYAAELVALAPDI